jgi:hypothetical protein
MRTILAQITRTLAIALAAAACTALSSGLSEAADICKAVALREVRSIEEPSDVLRAGTYITAVSQYTVDRKSGVESFCQHGGLCYPLYVLENGRNVEVLRLVNCKIGKKSFEDDQGTVYSLNTDRAKNSAAAAIACLAWPSPSDRDGPACRGRLRRIVCPS